jgi:ribosomal protein L37E
MGKRQKRTHILCRRCGKRALHIRTGICSACGFGNSKRSTPGRTRRVWERPGNKQDYFFLTGFFASGFFGSDLGFDLTPSFG